MRSKKKISAFLAMLLAVAMLLPNAVFANDGLVEGKTPAKIELVYLNAKQNPVDGQFGYEEVADLSKLDLDVNDRFYVGVRVSGVNNIKEATSGFFGICVGIAFDNTYLKLEPGITQSLTATRLKNAWSPRMQYTNSILSEDADIPYQHETETPNAEGNTTTLMLGTSWTGDGRPPAMTQESFFTAVVEFQVLKTPDENGAKVLDIAQNGSFTHIDFDEAGGLSYVWDETNLEQYMGTVVTLDVSGVDIFPAKAAKPVASGTVKVTGTLTYGETVTADVSGVTLPGDAALETGKYGFQWQRAKGSDWENITGATSATYQLKSTEVGKTVRCTLTSSDYDVTGVTFEQSSAAVAKKTLTLPSSVTVPAVIQDSTGAALTKTGTVTPGGVVSGDNIVINFSATYTADQVKNVGPVNDMTVSYTLPSQIANRYQLPTTTTNTAGTGSVTAKAISAVAFASAPTKTTYDVRATGADKDAKMDLTGATFNVTWTNGVTDQDVSLTDFLAAPYNGVVKIGSTTIVSGTTAPTAGKLVATANSKSSTNGATITVTTDRVLKSISVSNPTKAFTDGDTITADALKDAGVKVTGTFDDNGATKTVDIDLANVTLTIDGKAITLGTTKFDFNTMNGKAINVSYKEGVVTKTAATGNITVNPATSVKVTITGLTFEKDYDGTKAVTPTGTATYSIPNVDDSDVKYEFASANAGTQNIVVEGLKITGAPDTKITVETLTGTINKVKPTLTFKADTLSQTVGSVTAPTVEYAPASTVDGEVTATIMVEVVTTKHEDEVACSKADDPTHVTHDADCGYKAEVAEVKEYKAWADAVQYMTEAGTYPVKAYIAAEGVNFLEVPDDDAKAATGTLTVSPAPTGGGISGITVRYDVGKNGTLKGSATESVQRGKTPSKVPAVTAKEGYQFLGWSLDGSTIVDPTTVTINSSTTFTALYKSVKNTYISGYPDGTFRPDAQVSRAEIASMLARLNKDFDANDTYTGTATDVASGAWYSNFVNFGMNKGFISGYVDGTFQPDGKITRGEFASMMARYMGLTAGSKQFSDTADHWASNSIAALADAGIVTGYNDGSFKPNANLTRAEAVQMINTALKVQALTGEADVVPTDVTSAHWAYTQIIAAMNTDIKDIVK